MEQNRLLLILALSFVAFLMWEAWQRDYGPKPVAPIASTQQAPQRHDIPSASDVPSAATATSTGVDASVPQQTSRQPLNHGKRIKVVTDLFSAEIDTFGGDLRLVDLLKYPYEVGQLDNPIRLLGDSLPNIFVAQSGFAGKKSKSATVSTASPNHYTVYQAQQSDYHLADGQEQLQVVLNWTSPDGIHFNKIYTFKRGSYLIDVAHGINNNSAKEWRGNVYHQLQRTNSTSIPESRFVVSYMGGVLYSPEEKYQKIDFGDMEESNLSREVKGGWTAMIQHYFLGAWLPEVEQPFSYYTRVLKGDQQRYVMGYTSVNEYQVAPGQQQELKSRLFVGPKLQNTLEQIAPGLELTVDYGWLTVIAKPLFWLLNKIHGYLGNWGWAIIVLTILIKLVFYKLSEASYKSMANMKRIQPRLATMKERYADDKQKFNQAMMEMYKKEKINPLGGCLPILVQIPVFIALYWVLLESVELRQAEWILWIKDMSTADPYFILPVLMGATMLIQHKLNPTPVDPMQAKLMMALPLVFTVFFAFFPAGLVLYWVVNNTISIAQQWYITRVVLEKGKVMS